LRCTLFLIPQVAAERGQRTRAYRRLCEDKPQAEATWKSAQRARSALEWPEFRERGRARRAPLGLSDQWLIPIRASLGSSLALLLTIERSGGFVSVGNRFVAQVAIASRPNPPAAAMSAMRDDSQKLDSALSRESRLRSSSSDTGQQSHRLTAVEQIASLVGGHRMACVIIHMYTVRF
jgi:hypothetical protein